ncbi:hypothetical protein MRB53_007758 [Persea americana]|uniref:Uncharacterized protein n=1 Tax=Persea americana TaxID=3435 RepID=A0ACC2MKU8_PERAE|nr:hypothetical protein MRB53_007758 [Persea americana]
MLLMLYVEMNDARREDVWFLNSGCSNHMCGDKSLFCDLNEDFRQKGKLGNNTRMAVLGKGNVRLTDLAHLWHCRYGHLSYKGLRTLQFKKIVHGMPQFKSPSTVCANCMIGKQHRDSIPQKSNWRATEKLQLVHADLYGPISPISNSQKRTKLDAKSFTCVLLGVSEESKAYRLYDPVAKKVVISRDVVFEEDTEAVNAENDGAMSGEEEEVTEEPVGSPQTGENGRESSSSDERRARRPPGWMRDYASGEELLEEEDINVNLALFDSADPVHFEEAVKHNNWRIAMDMEIKAIKRNNTWELTDLPTDDLIFTGNDELMFAEFKNSMLREFDMTDLGRMRFFLGIEVLQRSDGIYICQIKYALEVLKRFRMENSNSVHNPIVPGAVELVYCGTQDQLADMMTKPLTLDAFQRSWSQLGVCQVPELN